MIPSSAKIIVPFILLNLQKWTRPSLNPTEVVVFPSPAGVGVIAVIHGNLRQNKRDRVIKAFRNNHFRILVGTDVASRGLDIPAIKHVINFDLPQLPEDFIHRIGRTARAGADGSALSFIGDQDRSKWNAIQRLINPNFKEEYREKEKNRRKNRGRFFNKKSRRGKNRFADKKRNNQDRHMSNCTNRNSVYSCFRYLFNIS